MGLWNHVDLVNFLDIVELEAGVFSLSFYLPILSHTFPECEPKPG